MENVAKIIEGLDRLVEAKWGPAELDQILIYKKILTHADGICFVMKALICDLEEELFKTMKERNDGTRDN